MNSTTRGAIYISPAFLDVVLLVLVVTLLKADFRRTSTVSIPIVDSASIPKNAGDQTQEVALIVHQDGSIRHEERRVETGEPLEDLLSELKDITGETTIGVHVETGSNGTGNTTAMLRLLECARRYPKLAGNLRIVVEQPPTSEIRTDDR